MQKNKFKIAVIAGDGIGKEVMPEGQRVLDAAAGKYDFSLEYDELPWSCDHYVKHGCMMPEDGLQEFATMTRFISARWVCHH